MSEVKVGGAPRSLAEVLFYATEATCPKCGNVGLRDTDVLAGSGDVTIGRGTCPTCGTTTDFLFGRLESWATPPEGALGTGDGASQILPAEMLRRVVERDLAQVPAAPPAARPEVVRAESHLRRAATALHELEKLGGGDPAQRQAVDRLVAAYRGSGTSPPAAQTLTELLKAHEAWLARGRGGGGRIEVADRRFADQRIPNVRLSGATFERCVFDGSNLSFAHLEGIVLTDCSFARCEMESAKAMKAMIARARMEGARVLLAVLDDAVVEGGNWRKVNAARAFFHRARLTGVDLRGASFRDAVLDGAIVESCDCRETDFRRDNPALQRLGTARGTRFVGCDFRGARLDGWRLDNTSFERCQFAGATGTPALEGKVTITEADVSVPWKP